METLKVHITDEEIRTFSAIKQEPKRKRGRPVKVVDEQSKLADTIKARFNKRKTINTQSYFDIYNPPLTDQELDLFVENHIKHVKAILESNGITNYAFTDTRLEYDTKLTNMYLLAPVLIINKDQYNIASKIKFSFN